MPVDHIFTHQGCEMKLLNRFLFLWKNYAKWQKRFPIFLGMWHLQIQGNCSAWRNALYHSVSSHEDADQQVFDFGIKTSLGCVIDLLFFCYPFYAQLLRPFEIWIDLVPGRI